MHKAESRAAWRDAHQALGRFHLLQSWDWGDFKQRYGWSAARYVWLGVDGQPAAAAQLLTRAIAGPLRMSYCPRGPLLDWADRGLRARVLADLAREARQTGAVFLKIDPPLEIDSDGGEAQAHAHQVEPDVVREWAASGWRPSSEQVQFRNTLTLDLQPGEEALLAGMKQKTRYNIRLAARKGVQVRQGGADDLDLLYRMYAETSLRDGFVIRTPAYYQDAWGAFIDQGLAQPFIAAVDEEPVAALILFRYGPTAYYMYGMSRSLHRDRMPNYLLQWEAIRWARANGCTTYDFWGAPDTLDPQDPLHGLYRFKIGFGARLVRTVGAWDLPLRPALFALYRTLAPRGLSLMRRLGRLQTRRALSGAEEDGRPGA